MLQGLEPGLFPFFGGADDVAGGDAVNMEGDAVDLVTVGGTPCPEAFDRGRWVAVGILLQAPEHDLVVAGHVRGSAAGERLMVMPFLCVVFTGPIAGKPAPTGTVGSL